MDLQEEEVIHLDYNSQDEYDIPESEDKSEDESDDEGMQGESEAKLMEFLLKGLVLQSSTCNVCDTPLIKSVNVDENPTYFTPSSKIEPIGNVPFCVSCNAHYVTNQSELQILWKDEYKAVMGVSGAVLLYMEDEVQKQPVFGKNSLVAEEEEEAENEVDGEKEDTHENNEDLVGDHIDESAYEETSENNAVEESDLRGEEKDGSRPSTAKSTSSRSIMEATVNYAETFDYSLYELIEYEKRRNIATKVLGAKMIEGFSLRETQCDKCTMPMMESPDAQDVLCVVCPVLQKKVFKILKAQKEQEETQLNQQVAEEERQLEQERLELAKKLAEEEAVHNAKLLEEEKKQMAIALAKAEEEAQLRALEEQRKLEEAEAARIEAQEIARREAQEAARKQAEEVARKEAALQRAEREATEQVTVRKINKTNNTFASEEKKGSQTNLMTDEEFEAEEQAIAKENKRKRDLRKKLMAEQRSLDEMKFKRQLEEDNLDEDEKQMLIDLRRARIAREEEEALIREQELERKQSAQRRKKREELEQKRLEEQEQLRMEEEKRFKEAQQEKKRKEQEQERLRLLEELRLAKEARAKEEERRKHELDLANQRAAEAKKKEEEREIERLRLIEELRVARQERMMEEMRRKEEAVKAKVKAEEAEKLIKMRDVEQERMRAELEESIKLQKEQEISRREEIAKAEQKAKEAEEQLQKWREEAEVESKRTEEVRLAAEKRVKEAEQSKVEAEQLAKEAKEAKALARAEKARLSERQRLNELAHRAEQHRLAAEAEAQKAQRALMKAEQKAKRYSEKREMHEGVLSQQYQEATQNLSKYGKLDSLASQLDEQQESLSRFSKAGRATSKGETVQEWDGLSEDGANNVDLDYGAPEDVEDDIEEDDVDEEEAMYNDSDDRSVSSRRSVTIELPENFDPSDPYAMAQLAAKAAAASGGRSVVSRSSRQRSVSNPRQRTNSRIPDRPSSQPRYQLRPDIPTGNRMPPKVYGRNPLPSSSRSHRVRSQSPRPEMRSGNSSLRGGYSQRDHRQHPESMLVPAQHDEEGGDDASDISDNVSVAKSVASHTLDAIMSKINDCKATLSAPIDYNDNQSVAKRGEAAALMQKLSAAAAAVKHLE